MDPRFWKKPWSRLFKGKKVEENDSLATTLETSHHYWNLTRRCMEQVSRMSSAQGSFAIKFNREQCLYLVAKLTRAVQYTRFAIEDINSKFHVVTEPEEVAQHLEIFKMLYTMGVEVEEFIQGCCQEEWIPSAIILANTSELVVIAGSHLEFCALVFCSNSLELPSIYQAEAKIVREMAHRDEAKLGKNLIAVAKSRGSRDKVLQASFLIERLRTATPPEDSRFLGSRIDILSYFSFSLKLSNDCLGKGASGIVYKAMWLGFEVAKKTFYGPKSEDFLQEVSILKGLSHPNIVLLLWYMTDATRCHLVLELMDGDLRSLIEMRLAENGNKEGPFSIPQSIDLMLQIGEGMLFLHEKRIVHRDLKSGNILRKLQKGSKGNVQHLQLKVADFGLSRTKELSTTYSTLTKNKGTTRWMAPELLKKGKDVSIHGEVGTMELKYPFKVDMYSFGMVCYEILVGDVPFSNLSHGDVKKAVLEGRRPELPNQCPRRLKILIEACWNKNASSRPSFDIICAELRAIKFGNIATYGNVILLECPYEDVITIHKLVKELSSLEAEAQQTSAYGIYLQVLKSDCHKKRISGHRAIPLLMELLLSREQMTQVHAIKTLQILSSDQNNRKTYIEAPDAIGSILAVLKSSRSEARVSAMATLLNLSSSESVSGNAWKDKLVYYSVVPALRSVLQGGTDGKEKLCAKALFEKLFEMVIC